MDRDEGLDAIELLNYLGEIISKLNSFSCQESLLTYLKDELKVILKTNSVWYFTCRPDNPLILDLISISGSAKEPSFENIPTVDASDDEMIKIVLASDEPIFIQNAHTDPRTDKRLVKASSINSILNSRVTIEGVTHGIFGAGTHFNEGFITISETQLAFFKALSKSVGICLDKFASQRRAMTDSLTQVLNREGLYSTVNTLISLAERNFKKVGVLYFDLNDFKIINDSFGHQAGDKVLQRFAKLISDCVRESDIVARVGGDEFVVILNNVKNEKNIEKVLNDIRDKASEPLVDELPIDLGYSVGYSIYPEEGNRLDTLIKVADERMYDSKCAIKVRS